MAYNKDASESMSYLVFLVTQTFSFFFFFPLVDVKSKSFLELI